MTDTEKIAMVKALVGSDVEATDNLITVYLTKAKSSIFNRMYPMGIPEDVTDVPAQYEVCQCELASRYFLRRGAEGELSHNENGIYRMYHTTNDEDLLKEVVQVLKL